MACHTRSGVAGISTWRTPNLIRRIWADENFVHDGKYWTVVKNGPLSPPLVQRPHPPFLVSAPRPRKSGSHQTPCWRELDSNFQFRAE
jgi:hypothetical protein